MRCRDTLGAIAAVLLLSASARPQATPPEPPTVEALLGATCEQLLDRLGVPATICSGHQTSVWSYPRTDGKNLDLCMHRAVVVQVRGAGAALQPRQDVPVDRPYLGQPVAQLVRLMGNAASVTTGSITASLHYADGTAVQVYDGSVVAVALGLQGTWRGAELGGGATALTIEFSAAGARVRVRTPGGLEAYEGSFAIDDTTSPRRAVLTIDTCAIPQFVGKQAFAIFELSGDRLRLAGTRPGVPQYPTGWEPSPLVRVFELERATH